ncbi:M23 family metallopeptidase [Candidatus Marithrix sp. Canyon 246]|uniref:M23 family metallopeptidase n=1 Tax=Candidatus Marithrix sp. Canyon 246 TaxID=1827136 RepID=UPI000849F7AE|nr:M23 family metallopeptidase [Candidatus Marithrix sp. Canyon 246]
MDVILVRKSFEKSNHTQLAQSIFVPVAFVSMLTVASVGYSAYNHSGNNANPQNDLENLALHVSSEQDRLNQWGQDLVNNESDQINLSISWDQVISGQSQIASRSLSSGNSSKINDVKPSIKIISAKILQKYRHRRMGTLPNGWPLKQGRVSSKYGARGSRKHKGMDIAVNTGTPVFAVEAATVIRSKYVRGYGNLVELRHSDMYSSRYGHNSKNIVKKGQRVDKGEIIALSGNTGRSTGPHVHFEVRQSGVAINPFKYLGAMKHFSLASNIPISKYVRVSSR